MQLLQPHDLKALSRFPAFIHIVNVNTWYTTTHYIYISAQSLWYGESFYQFWLEDTLPSRLYMNAKRDAIPIIQMNQQGSAFWHGTERFAHSVWADIQRSATWCLYFDCWRSRTVAQTKHICTAFVTAVWLYAENATTSLHFTCTNYRKPTT